MVESTFHLVSDAFVEGAHIPRAYTCEGADRSPPLQWSGAPSGTKSFVLEVIDPDAPGGEFVHWLLYDIEASTTEIEEGGSAGIEGRNDFQATGWGGPCPPPKHGDHRYVFTLSALDCETIGLLRGASREEVDRAAEGHVLARTTWMGRYRRD